MKLRNTCSLLPSVWTRLSIECYIGPAEQIGAIFADLVQKTKDERKLKPSMKRRNNFS